MNEPTIEYMRVRLQATADVQPMTVYCLLCPGWSVTGEAAVTRAASEAHRAKHHPELLSKRRIARNRRAFSSSLSEERKEQIEEERRQRMRALGLV